MQFRYTTGIKEYERMTTRELRESFLIETLFTRDAIELVYWETERTVTGSAVPSTNPLRLETFKELSSDYFCERRELGALNIGGPGRIRVDGQTYDAESLDCLYIGRGSCEIVFESIDPNTPAKFFLMSYPAHTKHPTTLAKNASVNQIKLGNQETANCRTIFQYIHEGGVKSCQLVMGFTQLEPGSVWNTMPAHTHSRRSEVYLYFDVPRDAAVFHLMGPGQETRHLVIHSEQAVLSPAWSIHSGCATQAYSFVWAMGGENQRFADMDAIAIQEMK
ncbi:MAG: 5-dehydro-4-deoxy-D-glucuronate isomerase [Verrucomicrobiota bacterium]